MEHLFLRLETGQVLEILPLTKNEIYTRHYFHFIDGKYMFTSRHLDLFDDKAPIRDKIQRTTKYFGVVNHGGMLRLIKFGYSIKNKIDDIITSVDDLFDDIYKIHVSVGTKSGFQSYDKCIIEKYPTDKLTSDEYFNSNEYKEIFKQYQDYINYYQIENRSVVLNLLKEKDWLKDKYNYLFRGMKINEIRKKRSTTTKTKLWNQVIKMVGDFAHENDRMEDIGYVEEGDGKNVHQFMIDGYLFEINLKDEIK